MVPHPFNYCDGAAVPYGKPLACDAPEECFSAGRAIQRDVADNDVFLGNECRTLGRINDNLATR